MMARIQRTCVIPLILLIVMLAVLIDKGVESAYEICFTDVQIEEGQSSDEVVLIVNGGNLLRVNSLYIDGERVKGCVLPKMTYGQTRATLDKSAFAKGNTWYELRVGRHKWGFIDLLSPPVWIEWTGE